MTMQAVTEQAELAGLSVTQATISNLETGRNPNPTIASVVAIARGLDVPVGHLLGEDTGPVPVELMPLVRNAQRLGSDDLTRLIDMAARLSGHQGERADPTSTSAGYDTEEELERLRAEALANPLFPVEVKTALQEVFELQDRLYAERQTSVT